MSQENRTETDPTLDGASMATYVATPGIERLCILETVTMASVAAASIVVVVPTFNNGSTLERVLQGICRSTSAVIVVNDGSTDATAAILDRYPHLVCISHNQNLGKGAALKTGLTRAAELGYTHVITIDSDSQHDPSEIPLFVGKIHENPEALYIGTRVAHPHRPDKVPARSRFGRSFGNFWYKFNTGITLHDTQCGFRAYPLHLIASLLPKCRGSRYEFEQELLIRAGRKGIVVKEIPITLRYLRRDEAVSHFRPIPDFLRISKVNAIAAMRRILLPVVDEELKGDTWFEKLKYLLRHEMASNTTPSKAAFSVALGVFVGIFPIHGIQLITLLFLGGYIAINRPLAFLGLCISSPPLLPFIILAAYATGKWSFSLPFLHHGASFFTGNALLLGSVQFVVGSILLAIVAGFIVYWLALILFTLFVRANAKNPNQGE